MKDQLQEVARAQKDRHEIQEKTFASSLSRIKTSVEVAEQVLRKGNELEILAAKNEITQQLTDVNSTTEMLPPRDMTSCDLLVDSTLDQSILQSLEKMSISGGDDEAEDTLIMYVNDVDYSRGQRPKVIGGPFKSIRHIIPHFEIRLKKDNMPKAEALNKVQVNIKQSGSYRVYSPAIKKLEHGSFSFNYCLDVGKYEMEVLVNWRHIKGSPFKWEVIPYT